ncbi:MAG: hypothetical protein IJM37_04500 [Lachnospiraceae bacterium]|nr:hypothetical protein [Lachnospiraceae bacterium]
MKEITLEELNMLPTGSYELIDIRDEGHIIYGMIPGAMHISLDEFKDEDNLKLSKIPMENYTVMQRSLAATRLHWGIIMMT